jgi:hypothetical protein
MDELCGFLEQSNISAKNIARAKILAEHGSGEVRNLAVLVLDIARIKPHKRRRCKFLADKHFDLFVRLKEFWATRLLRNSQIGASGLVRSGHSVLKGTPGYLLVSLRLSYMTASLFVPSHFCGC